MKSNTPSTKKFSLADLRAPMMATHASGDNLSYTWRRHQLQLLKKVIIHHYDEWMEALYSDLGKSQVEAMAGDVHLVEQEVNYQLKLLKQHMSIQQVPGPMLMAIARHSIERKPLRPPGVLVVSPFNYPLHLALLPAAGSLAAGNPTLVKPSELTPATSALMEKLVSHYFDPGALQVVQGAVPETTALLQEEWGMIFFTGSERVGKIVAAAAAKTLTPVVLELGGKSAVYVDETSPPNLRIVAERIVWGKTFNVGQTCVAPDYLVCHEMHAKELCKELVKAVERQFGQDPQTTSTLGRIVSTVHAQRHVDMLKEVEKSSQTEILVGGSAKCDPSKRFICPTIVLKPPMNCRLLKEEIFGPILPMVIVKNRQEAIQFIQDMPGIPLGLYVFTTSAKVFQQVTNACRSAASTRNDALGFQTASPYLPSGGLGTSGYGTHHGTYSYETFSHAYPTVYRPCGGDFWEFGMIRYQPFNPFKTKLVTDVLMKLPAIPVLHSRWVLSALVVAIGARFFVPAPWLKASCQAVATCLEHVAEWLRRSGGNGPTSHL